MRIPFSILLAYSVLWLGLTHAAEQLPPLPSRSISGSGPAAAFPAPPNQAPAPVLITTNLTFKWSYSGTLSNDASWVLLQSPFIDLPVESWVLATNAPASARKIVLNGAFVGQMNYIIGVSNFWGFANFTPPASTPAVGELLSNPGSVSIELGVK